jgi:aryl-alcohol dehydrogenase-like predicted oxidoreductase
VDLTALDDKDFRARNPRFTGEAGAANLAIVRAVAAVAERLGVAPAQLTLAWVLGQAGRLGVDVRPDPGHEASAVARAERGALDVSLDAADLADLDPLADQVVGARY